MDVSEALNILEARAECSNEGLPEDIFLMVSKLTPLVNVDLLVKNEKKQTLLTWRDDEYNGTGWHIPGGIIRFKEKISDRIKAVAALELGCTIHFDPDPLSVNEIILEQTVRGHFISFLFNCKLITEPEESLRYDFGEPEPTQWSWHSRCPDNLIQVHDIYRKFI